MAFPLTPNVGDTWTESGIRFRFTGDSWDFAETGKGQELIVAANDPQTGTNDATLGAIWRNSVTGEAFRYEASKLASTPITVTTSPSPGITANLLTPFTYSRQSFTLPLTSVTSTVEIKAKRYAYWSFDLTLKIYAGENTTAANETPGDSVFGAGTVIAQETISYGAATVDVVDTITFAPIAILPPGKATFVLEVTNAVDTGSGSLVPIELYNYPINSYDGGQFGSSNLDLDFTVTATTVGEVEWNPLSAGQDIIIASGSAGNPGFRLNGEPIQVGDLWIDSDDNIIRIYDGAAWPSCLVSYDPSVLGILTSYNSQDAIDEMDIITFILAIGAGFVGRYYPTTNTADFTTASTYVDGVLPAANTLATPGFLVVVEESFGQAPAPVVQMYKGDYLFAYPAGNTWIHFQVGKKLPTYSELNDTPSVFSGYSGYIAACNSTEDALEYILDTDSHSYRQDSAPTARNAGDIWVSTSEYEKVASSAGSASWSGVSYVTTSSSPPTSPQSGRLWYDTSTSSLYIYDTTLTPPSWVNV